MEHLGYIMIYNGNIIGKYWEYSGMYNQQHDLVGCVLKIGCSSQIGNFTRENYSKPVDFEDALFSDKLVFSLLERYFNSPF
jgi:hypothetical protein